jgi:hypothetical protein
MSNPSGERKFMSSISISGTGQGLFAFLQQLSGSNQSQAADSTSAASGSGTTASVTSAAADGQSAQGAAVHHHHGGHGGFAKIQQAVSDALQSASSDGSTDPNQVITDAITKALGGGTAPDSATDPQSATDASAQTSADATSSSPQEFKQLLQSYGIDPSQFHQDFMNAVKKAREGEIDPSTAFQSVPPGTNVDTTG